MERMPARTRGPWCITGMSVPPAGVTAASAVAIARRPTERRKGQSLCSPTMAPYEGKRGLVLGVANKRSIAWAIAKRLGDGGAQLAFTYQGERIEKSVRELADSVSSPLVTECDVRSDEDVARVFGEVGDAFGGQNIRVSAISAGPVRTLSARSIAGFPTMEAIVEERSPLHRHIEADDVGAAASFLLSDDAKNVTGTILYVDSGYHAMGM